ncbi:polyprotein [trumpeter swan calicivirus]|nr:polyprotein [trumpeter swan calicivirus]
MAQYTASQSFAGATLRSALTATRLVPTANQPTGDSVPLKALLAFTVSTRLRSTTMRRLLTSPGDGHLRIVSRIDHRNAWLFKKHAKRVLRCSACARTLLLKDDLCPEHTCSPGGCYTWRLLIAFHTYPCYVCGSLEKPAWHVYVPSTKCECGQCYRASEHTKLCSWMAGVLTPEMEIPSLQGANLGKPTHPEGFYDEYIVDHKPTFRRLTKSQCAPASTLLSEVIKAVSTRSNANTVTDILKAARVAGASIGELKATLGAAFDSVDGTDNRAAALLISTTILLDRQDGFADGDYATVLRNLDPKTRTGWRETIKSKFAQLGEKLMAYAAGPKIRSALEAIYEGLGWGASLNSAFLNLAVTHLKPIPFMSLIATFDGTVPGFVITLAGILQLYGLTDPGNLTAACDPLFNCIAECYERAVSYLNPFGRAGPKAQGATSFIAGLIALAVLLLLGHVPSSIARTIRNLSATAVSLVAIFKFVTTIVNMVQAHITARHVRSLTDKLAAITIELAKPATLSVATRRRELANSLREVVVAIENTVADPDYAKHSVALRALQAAAQNLTIKMNLVEGTTSRRTPPRAIVICGPPGIGKTTLVEYAADLIDPDHVPSIFSLHVDHFDAYSGEKVCIWDEFNTDRDGNFVETVISMVNSTPHVLNFDLPENKGRTFASDIVFLTTNTPTPVDPAHPRAEAFYRRLEWYDVCSPSIEDYVAAHPGVAPPKELFKNTFDHLELRKRPYLAYNARGDTLDGRNARPLRVTPKQFFGSLTKNAPTFQGTYRIYGFVTEDPPRVVEYLTRHVNRETGFATYYVTSPTDTEKDLPNTPGNLIVISPVRRNWPSVSWHDVTRLQDAPDLNTAFGLLPPLPTHENKHFTTELYRSVYHFGEVAPTKLPPKAHYRVNSLADLLRVLKRVYGAELLPVVFRLGKKLLIRDWFEFFQRISDVNWGPNYHSYALTTPVGIFSIYTQGKMAVFGAANGAPHIDPECPPKASTMTFAQLLWGICKRVVKCFYAGMNFGVNIAALGYFNNLCRAGPQADARRAFTGVALPDDQYAEWQTYKKRVDDTITVEDYVAARDALALERPLLEERVAALSRWMRAQRSAKSLTTEAVFQGVTVAPEAVASVKKADGTHVGWAVHKGYGHWIMNRHIATQSGVTLDGHDIELADDLGPPDTDVVTVFSYTAPAAVNLGVGAPVRFYDGRSCMNVRPHACNIGEIGLQGYTAQLNGGTKAGDCGLPYVNEAGQVVGIHSAFYAGSARVVISRIKADAKPVEYWRSIPTVASGIALGPLRKGTHFGRSPAFPDMQPWETHEPAAYGGGDPRGLLTQERILAAALAPYVTPPKELPRVVVDAYRYVDRFLRTMMSFTSAPQIEPLAVAVRRLNMQTSCGPFVPGIKSDYFFHTPSGPIMKPDTPYARHVNAALALAERGEPLQNAYHLALKDELLPRTKVKAGKKRLLWGTDCALTTLAACCFGDLFDKMKGLLAHSPIAVGCNMDSTFAAHIIAELQGHETVCLDYSKWDSTMSHDIIQYAYNIICGMLPTHPYVNSLRRTLAQAPVGYFMDRKVTTTTGLPSGTPGTSMINSICHCIYFVSAVWLTEDMSNIARTKSPLADCRIFTYGDDCIYGLTPRLASLLDTFIMALRALGLNPTAPDKSQNYELNGELTFLKRTLRPLNDMVLAPLELPSLLRQATWIKGRQNHNHMGVQKVSVNERSIQIEECIISLSAHGQSVWNDNVWIFYAVIKHEQLTCQAYTYEEAFSVYKSRYYCGDYAANVALLTGDIKILKISDDPVFQNGDQQPQQASDGFSAVPVGEENAAGTVTTAYAPAGAEAGAAGAPVNDSATLATLGAGPVSTLPPGIAGLFVRSARLTWNTTQPVNTLLGAVSLNPEVNSYLSHLSQMYNAWSGSMYVQIQISGSGMYGGRAIASVLPPGVAPTSVTNPTDYPYAIIDARLVAPLHMLLPDLRNSPYHLVDTPDVTTTIAVYVSAPLINPFSNEGISAAEITIYTTPAQDFGFMMLKQPSSRATNYSNLLGTTTANWTGNRTGAIVVSLGLFQNLRFSWNHFTTTGETQGWGTGRFYSQTLWQTNNPTMTNSTCVAVKNIPLRATVMENLDPGIVDWPCFGDTLNSTTVTGRISTYGGGALMLGVYGDAVNQNLDFDESQGAIGVLTYGMFTVGGGYGPITTAISGTDIIGTGNFAIKFAAAPTGTANDNYVACVYAGCHNPNNTQVIGTRALITPGTPTAYPTPGNLLVGFNSEALGTWPTRSIITSGQPTSVSMALFSSGINIPSGYQLVFRLTNPAQSFELGLRPDGYFQTGGSNTATIEITEDYAVEVSGLVPLNTPLVGPTAANGNRVRRLRGRND